MSRYLTRRRFMAASLAAVPAVFAARAEFLDAAPPRPLDAATRRALGMAVPEQRWRGDSSLAAAARHDRSLFDDSQERRRPRRPRPEPAPGSPAPDEWAGYATQLSALAASRGRIQQSARTTLGLQLDAALINRRRGFFATDVNSFNEWHEGTAFEAAADFATLSPEQRAIGYHNPDNGRWRLQAVQDLLGRLMSAA